MTYGVKRSHRAMEQEHFPAHHFLGVGRGAGNANTARQSDAPGEGEMLQEQAPPALKQGFTAALGSFSCCCPFWLVSGAQEGCPSFCQGPALLLSPFPRAELAGEEDALLVVVPIRVSLPAGLEGPSLCLAASGQLLCERCC